MQPYDAARLAAMTINPRDNYFFIFYSEQLNTYWIIPSREFVKIVSKNKKGKNKVNILWAKIKISTKIQTTLNCCLKCIVGDLMKEENLYPIIKEFLEKKDFTR